MGVQRKLVKPGNGVDYPKKGDNVTMEYTGNLYDEAAGESKDFRGTQFDSSVGRGAFTTAIGVGKVIKGWDDGVTQMSLGERSILTMSGDFAYGDQGFPGLIPPNASLVFEVELKAINDKKHA
ncbi:hypothetical protein MMC10_002585 [Thelotrema lepadinum]|nr:hypothetical protein [Thelotrema lepadinum]